jgi:hypothetical protein
VVPLPARTPRSDCSCTLIVPDQLRNAVKGPDRYEPDINATYLEMAQHCGVTVIPARPRKPNKAKVEGAVLIVHAGCWRACAAADSSALRAEPGHLGAAGGVERKPFQKLDVLHARIHQRVEVRATGAMGQRLRMSSS